VGVPIFPYYTLAFSYPDTVDIPKMAQAVESGVQERGREFTVEVRAHLAMRAEGVVQYVG